MMSTSTVQRAFELAPACKSIRELKSKLRREGCAQVEDYLGGSIVKQLTALMGA
jgi:hypothetical protein